MAEQGAVDKEEFSSMKEALEKGILAILHTALLNFDRVKKCDSIFMCVRVSFT